jgi:hypothetical protein
MLVYRSTVRQSEQQSIKLPQMGWDYPGQSAGEFTDADARKWQ